ncbi:MAG TPA: ankyrin repeat domain-containing protein [Candidatus Acidoferrum sp.]
MTVNVTVAELFDAIRAGELSRVKSLLDSEPALASAKNEKGVSAVLFSIYSGRTEIRDLLLAQGAKLELQDAAAAGCLDRVKEVVEENPMRASSFSEDGFPVVALASVFGHFEVARYLAEKGADINAAATNGSGYNALTGAVASGHLELVKWLLESSANANYKYGPGYTPLLTAAANGRLDIIKLLLTHGADPAATTDDGKSALALAVERNHPAIADYLRNLAT